MMLVRLKPFNARIGYKMRSYTYQGIKIEENRGWYEVSDDVAAYLGTVRADPENADGPYAFDVATYDAAKQLEENERKAARMRAEAGDPIRVHQPARRVQPVASGDPAAQSTHYGRPINSPNRARTHLARPDESEASRDYSRLTGEPDAQQMAAEERDRMAMAIPGAPRRVGAPPRRRNPEENPGDEYKLEVTDLSEEVASGGAYAGAPAPFVDGSPLETEDQGPSPRNPDPRNLGERQRGAYDDTPFVDGSPDGVSPHDAGPDPRNPDPRNIGARAAGAYDDTPFVDGSRDAVVPPFSPPQSPDDFEQMRPVRTPGGPVAPRSVANVGSLTGAAPRKPGPEPMSGTPSDGRNRPAQPTRTRSR